MEKSKKGFKFLGLNFKLVEVPFAAAWAALLVVLPLAVWGAWAQGAGPVIVSGPSASGINETQAVIAWQTDEPSTSVVHFGVTEALGQTFRKIVPMEETEITEVNHSITLWELAPGTTYYYRVTSVGETGGSASSGLKTFVTLPPAPTCTADEWSCDVWGACSASGIQSRTCSLKTDCAGVETAKPAVEQPCAPTCDKDVWECGSWEACSADGRQKRVCTLKTDCAGVETPRPSAEQACVPPAKPQEKEPMVERVEMVPPEPAAESAVETAPEKLEPPPPPLPPPPPPAPAPEQPTPVSGGGLRPVDAVPEPPVAPTYSPAPAAQVAAALEEAAAGSDAPPSPVDVCAKNNVSSERCDDWLGAKYGDKRCLEDGIVGREGCVAHLSERNGGVFPGCEGRSREECDAIEGVVLAGYDTQTELEVANLALRRALESGDTAVALASGAAAVRLELSEGFAVRPSTEREGQQTSPAVLVLDVNRNGIPDELEEKLGAVDEGEAPSPLREDPTAKALLSLASLEQPRGGGETDPAFTVAPATSAGAAEKGTVLRGTCAPGAVCLVYVYSYMPLVLTTVADENGNWSYDLGESLGDGEHTVYVVVTDETGKIARKSNPMSLFVSAAQAVSAEDFLRPDATSLAAAPIERQRSWYLVGVAVLIAFAALSAGVLAFRRPRRTPIGA